MNQINIIPLRDLYPHYLGSQCLCAPTVRDNLIRHNSHDHREKWEKLGYRGAKWGTYRGPQGRYASGSYSNDNNILHFSGKYKKLALL